MKTVTIKLTKLMACLGVFMLVLAGCNSSDNQDGATAEATETEASATESTDNQDQAGPTDPQIASIAVSANQIDVNYGKIALEKSENAEIRKFAQTMINDHENIIKQAVELATKLGVTPEMNPTTQSLLDGEKEMTAKLNGLSGAEFDKVYAQNEADYHDAVVGAVKTVLIPSAQNAELKSLLESVVPLLDHHLEMAKEMAAKFNQQ